MSVRVAVLGATGVVGKEILAILEERLFPADAVHALASRRSIGAEVSYGERTLKCQDVEAFDFTTVDLAFLAVDAEVARQWAGKIAAAGATVIDNSTAYRMDPAVPLVVPEVNADALADFPKKIIANPNCAVAQLVVALKPIHDRARIRRVVAATYQSTSGAGKDAMDELWTQTRGIYVNDPIEKTQFTKQIAFNVIPHIGDFMEDGTTGEEWKMVAELKKILDPKVKLIATCVRVPTFVGHAEAVTVELEEPLSADEARELLREAPGLMVVDKRDDEGYVTPVECVGEFATFVSRLRDDPTVDNGLALWIVSDNLRKGAALNAVQVAELLVNRGLLKRAA